MATRNINTFIEHLIPFAPTPVDPYRQKPAPPVGGGY